MIIPKMYAIEYHLISKRKNCKSNRIKIIDKHFKFINIGLILLRYKFMSKSRLVLDQIAKLFEQGIINYKDFSKEIFTILNSKREEFVYKMKLASNEDLMVVNKRLEKLEKKIESLERKKEKIKKVKK